MKYGGPALLLGVALLFGGCKKEAAVVESTANKVLMLQVDFLTNTFEGGKEFTFSGASQTFTIKNEYKAPSDFGSIKLLYQELGETLFDATILWLGTGRINYPENLAPASGFTSDSIANIVGPGAGFENIFNPPNLTNFTMPSQDYNYQPVWLSIQHLTKVREYLKSNPTATVKLFLYTPSVGLGNPADADWIIFLKN